MNINDYEPSELVKMILSDPGMISKDDLTKTTIGRIKKEVDNIRNRALRLIDEQVSYWKPQRTWKYWEDNNDDYQDSEFLYSWLRQDVGKRETGRPQDCYKDESEFIQERYIGPVNRSLTKFPNTHLSVDPYNAIKAMVSVMTALNVFIDRGKFRAKVRFFAKKYGIDPNGFTDFQLRNEKPKGDIFNSYHAILKSELNGNN